MTGLDGLGRLIDDYDGDTATVRWLSIHLDRRVVERVSDNRIGWSTAQQMWVQARLLQDVVRLVDPISHGGSLTAATLIHTPRGLVVTTRRDVAVNPIVTGMLAELRVHRAAHGTVAWLTEADPGTGFHGDMDDHTRAELRELAERHGATVDPHDAGTEPGHPKHAADRPTTSSSGRHTIVSTDGPNSTCPYAWPGSSEGTPVEVTLNAAVDADVAIGWRMPGARADSICIVIGGEQLSLEFFDEESLQRLRDVADRAIPRLRLARQERLRRNAEFERTWQAEQATAAGTGASVA